MLLYMCTFIDTSTTDEITTLIMDLSEIVLIASYIQWSIHLECKEDLLKRISVSLKMVICECIDCCIIVLYYIPLILTNSGLD